MKTTAETTKNESKQSYNPVNQKKEGKGFFPAKYGQGESFFGPAILQPKLEIGQPNDPYEKEADRVADQVMRMPEAGIQRKCGSCEQEEKIQQKPLIQRSVATGGNKSVSPGISSAIAATRGSGSALPKTTQQEMGSKIGADFSGVKIHTDNTAVQLSQDLGAKAFTVGNDIYFNQGQYNPTSGDGKRLMAHELVHTVQQKNNQNSINPVQRQPFDEAKNRVTKSLEDARKKTKVETVEKSINNAKINLNGLRESWVEALRNLEDELEEPDIPSVGEALMKEILLATISNATFRLGGILLKRLMNRIKVNRPDINQVSKNVMEDVRGDVAGKMKNLVDKNFSKRSTASGRSLIEQFIENQFHIVNDFVTLEQKTLESKKIKFLYSERGAEQAKAIEESYDIGSKVAYDIQYLSAVGQWGKLLSHSFARKKTKLFENRVQVWSGNGMLNITVSMKRPAGTDLKIVNASWPGLNDSTRSRLMAEFGEKSIIDLDTNVRFNVIIEKSQFLDQQKHFTFEYIQAPKGSDKVIMGGSGITVDFLSQFSAGSKPIRLPKGIKFEDRRTRAKSGAYALAGLIMGKNLNELSLN